jgi:hypothetical protein
LLSVLSVNCAHTPGAKSFNERLQSMIHDFEVRMQFSKFYVNISTTKNA